MNITLNIQIYDKEITVSVPKVFVSYSHDTQEHKQWVLELATRLRSSGIDAVIDQWELGPGDDLPHFMESNLASVDRVIMICTDRYVEKANSGSGGVGYEKMIITSDLLSRIDSNKVIPIVKQDASNEVPIFLKSKLYINFSKKEDYELSFDDLVRAIHGAPLFEKPEIGNNPFQPVSETLPQKNNDLTMTILRAIIEFYDSGKNAVSTVRLASYLECSRIICEIHIVKLVEDGLVFSYGEVVELTNKVKIFAINKGLVA